MVQLFQMEEGTAVQMLHKVLGKKYPRCECSSSPPGFGIDSRASHHVQLSQLPANITDTVSAAIRADQQLQSGVHFTLRVAGLLFQDSLGPSAFQFRSLSWIPTSVKPPA